MGNTELEHAKRMLKAWQDAEYAAATGNKSYMINGRRIERYSLKEINDRINYWLIQVHKAEQGMNSTMRIGRAVPWQR